MAYRLALVIFVVGTLLLYGFFRLDQARAETIDIQCPAAAKSCKVLILTPQEVNALVGDKMILQTAAQARSLDLGQVVNYFLTKLAAAPDGKVVAPKPAEKPPEGAEKP